MHLIHGNDHGEHDGDLTESRRAKDRTKLRLEDLRSGETDPDRPKSHGRILFLRQFEIICLLIRTDVQGPDDDLLSCQGLRHLFIDCELFILGGIILRAQIDEFRTEESDPAGIIL